MTPGNEDGEKKMAQRERSQSKVEGLSYSGVQPGAETAMLDYSTRWQNNDIGARAR